MTASAQAAQAALGRHRRFTSTPSHTAKKLGAKVARPNPAQVAGSFERLQNNDAKFKFQRLAAQLLPDQSVAKCGAVCVDESGVQVARDASGRAYARGLMRCKSVWHCPVCAAKIAERRRHELIGILQAWRATGGHVYMLTLTLPHQAYQSLDVVFSALNTALKRFNSGRSRLKVLLESAGFFGQIRALEVTHGAKGWHPHQHILLLTERELTDDHVATIQSSWARNLAALGFPTVRPDVAAQVQGGDSAAEYVTKSGWGMAEEISKAHIKRGGLGGRTPFQLLEAAALGDDMAASWFVEYAHVFKGKKQIFMSKSVAKFARDMQIETKEDAEIVETDDAEIVEVVGYIEQADWSLIYRYNMRAELLHAVELRGADGMNEIVEIVRAMRAAKISQYN